MLKLNFNRFILWYSIWCCLYVGTIDNIQTDRWLCLVVRSAPALSQLDQLLTIGPRTGFIYSRLFKFTQQHSAAFTERIALGPYILKPALVTYAIDRNTFLLIP